jgi:DNA-binding CsgD family transcriptional regulator
VIPGLTPSVFVGREDEVRCLRGLVAEVAAGRGRSVWVEGEPGIGKSALLATGLAQAQASGCQLFWESADQARRRFPLWVLLDCLQVGPRAADDPLRAEIARLLRGEGSGDVIAPVDVTTAVAERLLVLVDRLCVRSPVVLVVDDLQWADEASLGVWERLHKMVGQLPLLLVAACRQVPVRPEAEALRANVTGDDAVVIELGPLRREQVADLVGELAGAQAGPRLERQAGQAGGNPLYVRELVDALVREQRVRVQAGTAELVGPAGPPGSLAAAIAGRVGFLTEPAARILGFAALLGQEFSIADLAVLTGQAEDELAGVTSEAVSAGVLAGSGERLVFRHGLIHQALYEGMPAALRVALHRHAAQALAGAGAPAERIAEHLLAAPSVADAWTVEWMADTAQVLIYRAPQIAVELLERVRAAAGAQDPRREQLDVALVTALSLLGRYEEVQGLAGPVLAGTGDATVAGRMAWALGYALLRGNQRDEGLAVIGQVRAERTLPAVWSARLRALEALLLIGSDRPARAEAIARQAEAEGERAADRFAVAYALHTLSLARVWQERDDEACLEIINRALAVLGDQPETTDLRLTLLGNRMAALTNLDRPAETDRAIGETLALAEQAGTPVQLARFRTMVADRWCHVGRWDDALAELDAASALLRSDRPRWLYLNGIAALILAHRDDRTALHQHLRAVDGLDLTDDTMRHYAQLLQLARAVAAERDGQPEQALALLRSVLDPASAPAPPADLPDVSDLLLPDMVRLLLATGDHGNARVATELCEADARSNRSIPLKQAAAEHCRGLLDADPAALLLAADRYYKITFPLYRGVALENAAALLAANGDTQGAKAAYAEAVEVYTGLDAAWDLRRADTRLRALGIRRGQRGPRRRPVTGWDALTPTELNIAALVAQGRSNPDIAADLFLSRRTVQSHVSNILTKLGARSRLDIARAVADRRAGVRF